jgi:hypothetical protein
MSASCRLRATLEALGGFQCLAGRPDTVRSVSRDTGLRNHAQGGSGGWYWEVNSLPDIRSAIIPFFDRFPLVGAKAHDFTLFAQAAALLAQEVMSDADYRQVLLLREQMNRGGKRRYTAERILRDYTPSSSTT